MCVCVCCVVLCCVVLCCVVLCCVVCVCVCVCACACGMCMCASGMCLCAHVSVYVCCVCGLSEALAAEVKEIQSLMVFHFFNTMDS